VTFLAGSSPFFGYSDSTTMQSSFGFVSLAGRELAVPHEPDPLIPGLLPGALGNERRNGLDDVAVVAPRIRGQGIEHARGAGSSSAAPASMLTRAPATEPASTPGEQTMSGRLHGCTPAPNPNARPFGPSTAPCSEALPATHRPPGARRRAGKPAAGARRPRRIYHHQDDPALRPRDAATQGEVDPCSTAAAPRRTWTPRPRAAGPPARSRTSLGERRARRKPGAPTREVRVPSGRPDRSLTPREAASAATTKSARRGRRLAGVPRGSASCGRRQRAAAGVARGEGSYSPAARRM